jgi:CRISPR-associated endonuclease/helicase Cas3
MHIEAEFRALTGFAPLSWQKRLYREHLARGGIPGAVDVPTGLGKTSVIALWLIARAHGAPLPRRLVYMVDRRAVVDQATDEAEKLRKALDGEAKHLKTQALGLGARKLPISTLRGAYVDNREWLDDPAAPAIIVGTVDMIGSRLLFEGYGVSRKLRPFQAALLGVDALIVLDEAHLVPPFAHLLRSIEQDRSLWPRDAADRQLLPRFAVLPLSATQGNADKDADRRAPFRLQDADKTDKVVAKRLDARKRLRLEPLAEKDQDRQLAEAAWALATRGGKFARVVIFCNRRDKQDDGGGPSAQGVRDGIEALTKGNKKAGRPKVEIHPVELLVGARRVRERQTVAQRLRELGFIGGNGPPDKPAFLVATAAGEVGVDIDADHMVSDLVTWERVVQRLGRVNRRGGEGRAAEVLVFDTSKLEKDEVRRAILERTLALLEHLESDASPGALRALQERRSAEVVAASTPEPLRPALNRALVDAWSMTSLATHTGRPEVAPWLRGWVEPDQQTTVVWRTYLPVRKGVAGWPRTRAEEKEIEDFFEAAPPHESEKLETETFRVIDWLEARARALMSKRPAQSARGAEPDETEEQPAEAMEAEAPAVSSESSTRPEIHADGIVAIALSAAGDFDEAYRLRDFMQKRDSNAKKSFEAGFYGRTLVVDARLGGLKDGLLASGSDSDDLPETADTFPVWSKDAGFRVVLQPDSEEDRWSRECEFALRRDAEGGVQERLVVEHFKDAARKEDARSISKPQELAQHQDWARREMLRIAGSIGLPDAAAKALAVGAYLHDEGKRAPHWQRAFQAPRDAKRFNLSGPLAKTRGPIDQAILGGYRHELGSLPSVEKNPEFMALSEEWRDLVLHLVAAHHGQARPTIETRGCEDGPPSQLEERAREVALRFARLQKRWGPWGLAWWEALLRAADQQASRDNEEGQAPSTREKTR